MFEPGKLDIIIDGMKDAVKYTTKLKRLDRLYELTNNSKIRFIQKINDDILADMEATTLMIIDCSISIEETGTTL